MGDYPDGYLAFAGSYLQSEWQAREGNDKSFYAEGGDIAFGGCAAIYYTVPAGKTLYINNVSFASFAYLAADGDKNQISLCHVQDVTSGVEKLYMGGNGGGGASFSTPFVIPAGHRVSFTVCSRANHSCGIRIVAWGYEI